MLYTERHVLPDTSAILGRGLTRVSFWSLKGNQIISDEHDSFGTFNARRTRADQLHTYLAHLIDLVNPQVAAVAVK